MLFLFGIISRSHRVDFRRHGGVRSRSRRGAAKDAEVCGAEDVCSDANDVDECKYDLYGVRFGSGGAVGGVLRLLGWGMLVQCAA